MLQQARMYSIQAPRKDDRLRQQLAASGPISPALPLRNDSVTMADGICPVCGNPFRPVGRRRYCSDACRQAAWRARNCVPKPILPIPDGTPRSDTVYECPSCGVRYLGEQRCPDCQLFCRRIGPGGNCPHCDEPVAISDLISNRGR
jgi:predicted amidophosphoribosyltransferase